MARDLRLKDAPPPEPQRPQCLPCKSTGLLNRDDSERVLTGESSSLDDIVKRFKACPFCADGQRWAKIEADWRKLHDNRSPSEWTNMADLRRT
jgi:hypothetical protein